MLSSTTQVLDNMDVSTRGDASCQVQDLLQIHRLQEEVKEPGLVVL